MHHASSRREYQNIWGIKALMLRVCAPYFEKHWCNFWRYCADMVQGNPMGEVRVYEPGAGNRKNLKNFWRSPGSMDSEPGRTGHLIFVKIPG
jgi:hypothetical protein